MKKLLLVFFALCSISLPTFGDKHRYYFSYIPDKSIPYDVIRFDTFELYQTSVDEVPAIWGGEKFSEPNVRRKSHGRSYRDKIYCYFQKDEQGGTVWTYFAAGKFTGYDEISRVVMTTNKEKIKDLECIASKHTNLLKPQSGIQLGMSYRKVKETLEGLNLELEKEDSYYDEQYVEGEREKFHFYKSGLYLKAPITNSYGATFNRMDFSIGVYVDFKNGILETLDTSSYLEPYWVPD